MIAMERQQQKRPPVREWHGTHQPWRYRPNAFRWEGARIAGINFVPIAGPMRAWMQQQGSLFLISREGQTKSGGYYNPYVFSGCTLSLLLGRVVNACHDFEESDECDLDPIDAEVERLRLYNEAVLLTARVTEVAIKQLLYCTAIPEKHYRRMALGGLLESPCPGCKKAEGDRPHLVSLMGSLAHPFHLCLEFDKCALDHMFLVNKLRNAQAAHSEIQNIIVRSPAESKAQLRVEATEVFSGFLHLLTHLEKVESRMLDDLAAKAAQINVLKASGLPPEECNFNLVPGKRFVFDPDRPESEL